MLLAIAWIAGACSSFSSPPDATPDAGADAAVDAPNAPPPDAADDGARALSCKTLVPPPIFCADFDDGNTDPIAYVNGVAVTMPKVGIGPIEVTLHDGVSPPNALWLASDGGTYNYDAVLTATATRLKGRLSVRFASFSGVTNATNIFRIGISSGCLVDLKVTAPSIQLLFEANCKVGYTSAQALPGLPPATSWTTFDIDVDLGGNTAKLKINDKDVAKLDIGAGNVAGKPYVQLGIIDTQGLRGPTIALDDIVVEAL